MPQFHRTATARETREKSEYGDYIRWLYEAHERLSPSSLYLEARASTCLSQTCHIPSSIFLQHLLALSDGILT